MELEKEFKALADNERRKILLSLRKKEMTAGKIVKLFSLSNTTISYHLLILKKANLISERKYKNYIYYKMKKTSVTKIINWLIKLKKE